jgi:hypothetical protein
MVLDPASTATPAQIAELSQRVLADPAMLNLEHAESVERFFAETIIQGTPRSDPMIDPAIAHFRWDSSDNELQRPPIVAWVLQRANDRYFEMELPTESRGIARILDLLRRPHPTGGCRSLSAWWLGPRVEYLIAYLQTYHPTVLTGLDQETLRWWVERIDRQRKAVFPVGPLYEFRRKGILRKPLKHAGLNPVIGCSPFLLLLFLTGFIFANLADESRSPPAPAPTPTASPVDTSLSSAPPTPPVPVLADMARDIDRILGIFSEGGLSASSVRTANPPLYARLEQAWKAARDESVGGDGDAFQHFADAAGAALDSVLVEALRGPDERLIFDHAAYYESRLRWTERASPEECVDFLSGAQIEAPMPSLQAVRRRLVARAVLSGAAPAKTAQARSRFAIPATLMNDAAQRARLSRTAFGRAMEGKGPAVARCNAMIALLDSAMVRRDKESLQLLRSMFGG